MSQDGATAGLTCWVVSDGKAGMVAQCLGLAEALGFAPIVKRIQVRRPWRWLPPTLLRDPLATLGPKGDALTPPWPDVLIASGRQTIASSMAIRRLSGGRTFTVQIQNPVVDASSFDVVVAPRHDRLRGSNVIASVGGLNRITPESLAREAARFAPRVADLPRPLVCVLLGGNNKVYRMTDRIVRRLGARLAELARREGAGLLVTPSRRTRTAHLRLLRDALAGQPAYIWDGTGENPYLGFLAIADAFVVTADSVNMVSEAATTGKPVYVVPLTGGSGKFRRFHRAMSEAGITRPFEGRLEHWTYPPLRDTAEAAAEIHRRLAERGLVPAAELAARA
jgi:mitochondrial fission protein ELM1